MNPPRRRFLRIIACAAVGSAACGRLEPLWRGRAFGADVAVELGDGWPVAPGQVRRRIVALIRRLEALFSLYDGDSTLARLNRDGTVRETDPVFAALLRRVDRIHTLTGGIFDPTIQGPWRRAYLGEDPTVALAGVGWRRFGRRNDEYALAAGQMLSFNGIGQGFATDAVVAALRALGATRALVDIGEHGALGGPFRLGFVDPRFGLLGRIDATDSAVAVSSPAAMQLPGGLTHVLHPSLQRNPLWSSVCVEADSATVADGLSTAICLMTRREIETMALTPADGVRRILLATPSGDLVLARDLGGVSAPAPAA